MKICPNSSQINLNYNTAQAECTKYNAHVLTLDELNEESSITNACCMQLTRFWISNGGGLLYDCNSFAYASDNLTNNRKFICEAN